MNLVHRSKYFAVYQCDNKRRFLFETAYKSVWLSFCQLLALRQRVNEIDLMTHFDEHQNPSGIEILVFCNREHVLILNTHQVIDLKECMATAFILVQQSELLLSEL